MLSLVDCLAMCALSEDEILAIAEHEHLPEIAALELGDDLMHHIGGIARICGMIRDDIEAARLRGDLAHAARLKLTLRHFLERQAANPEARTS